MSTDGGPGEVSRDTGSLRERPTSSTKGTGFAGPFVGFELAVFIGGGPVPPARVCMVL